MSKKNVCLAQPSYMSSNSVPFPAAIGALAAYAWSFADIDEAFCLKEIVFQREKQSALVARLEAPAVFGFSWELTQAGRQMETICSSCSSPQ